MYANLSPGIPKSYSIAEGLDVISTLDMSVRRRTTACVSFHQQAATLVCIAAAIELMCEPLALIFQYQLLVGVRGKPITLGCYGLVMNSENHYSEIPQLGCKWQHTSARSTTWNVHDSRSLNSLCGIFLMTTTIFNVHLMALQRSATL